METYRKSILEYDDVRSAVDYAREEGVEFGIRKGREEGIRKEKRALAIKCLKRGYSIQDIRLITELSEEEIRELQKTID